MNFQNLLTTKNILFSFLILLVLYLIVIMPDIALLVFFSYVISSAINPLIEKLSKKMPRTLATLVMLIAITLIVIGLFVPIIVMSANEIKDFLNTLPSQIENLQKFIANHTYNGKTLFQLIDLDTMLSSSSALAKTVINKSINFTVGFMGLLTVLVTMGIIVFFLSNERHEIKSYCLKLFPEQMRNRASEIIDELEIKVGGYVSAQLICITIVGTIVAAILMLLRVDYAVLIGFISAVLDLIPVVGPVLTGVIILLAAAPKGVLITVLAIGALLFAQFVENNWAKPYFFSKYMDLHPLIVIFSFIIAAKFIGVAGVVIAPAIAAVIITLFDELYIKTMNKQSQANQE